MRKTSKRARLVTLLSAGAILLAACGSDSDDTVESSDTTVATEAGDTAADTSADTTAAEATDTTEAGAVADGESGSGGEFIDGAQFGAGRPPHIDPAFTSELDGAQVTTALYDGLTDFTNGPDGPELKGLVAESWESNAEATQWTFKIKEGLTFSNGEPVLPSSFVRGWNRAADPNLATDYSYLFGLVKGYTEWSDDPTGITSLSGVVGDDDAMTLTVDLAQAYADFPSVASHIIFSPMPEEVESLSDQTQYEAGLLVGNGPFMMESPLTDTELVLVPNPNWAGDVDGNTTVLPSKVTFKISADIDSAYAAFEAGETMSATIPSGRFADVTSKYDSTGTPLLGSYHFVIGMRAEDPLGGDANAPLRKAIQAVVDTAQINDAVYDGSRTVSTGVTPPGIPGFKEGLCENCGAGVEAAQKLVDDFVAGGGVIPDNIKLTFNAGAGHEDVVAIVQQNLESIGITAEQNPIASDVYFKTLRDEGCPGICRAGWFWDYPIYDNGMYDLFHVESAGNNLGKYDSAVFNDLVTNARKTLDLDERLAAFNDAETQLLNTDAAVIPINWYNGDQVFAANVTGYAQEALGWVRFEKISVSDS